ncbi:MAG: M20/M25/M40 family metallo-hydrolase [Kordiimonadaceae bacterium]|nr:M20/M25/M40 family metallo-hydrolase [Kordiimonadaceae bacterium]MBO6567635.1 M20/M25/M40 family metallo-hydrolase [Kordiimonadaceae bacterium]MBO6963151.1 M20/M25/M40 family metallo-hydrolase [Kordiimonadaceae bacterium]
MKKLFLCAGVIASLATAVTAQQAPNGATIEALTEKHLRGSFPLLKDLLSIPSDAHFPDHVAANVAWMTEAFDARGFATTKLDTGGPPLLLAERPVEDATKTVLIYLQVDGQPVDPSRWNQESPYKPVLKERSGDTWAEIDWSNLEGAIDPEWRVFARAASDAKGPIAMFLTALDILEREALNQTHNIKVIMDFEEELGSPHLPAAVEKYKDQLTADMLLIYDGPRHTSNRPTLVFGARGIATVSLTVFGPRRPQHSGTYGNYAPNPAVRLAQLVGGMEDADGRVTIPGFYDGITLSEEVKAIINSVPDDEPAIRRSIGFKTPDAIAPTYQESIQYPSMSVLGLESGWVGAQTRTAIPATATAELDIRLVLESDPERLVGLVRKYVEDQGYHVIGGAQPSEEERQTHDRLISFTYEISYAAFRTPLNAPAGDWAERALVRAFGEQPIKIRTGGGSIPISPFVKSLGLPAILVPAVFIDNNQHSPNENLRLGNYIDGIRAYLAILTQPD